MSSNLLFQEKLFNWALERASLESYATFQPPGDRCFQVVSDRDINDAERRRNSNRTFLAQ